MDLAHQWGQDLQLSPTGGLELAAGDALVQQRLIRRLMTAAGDYFQHIDYGAGLGAFVGQPANAALIAGVIKRQAKKEASIAQSPPPVVTVTYLAPDTVTCTIAYTDSVTGQPATREFPLTGP